MKELFQKAIEWLRSRVTAIVKVKGDRLKRSEVRTPKIERLHSNDNLLKVKGDRLKVRSLNEHRCLQSMGSEVGDLPLGGG